MPVYQYEAIAKSGKNVKGVIDADSPAVARRKLREQDLFPTAVSEQFTKEEKGGLGADIGGGRISMRDISMMTRQLAVLLQAGMPLVDGMTALLEQTPNPRLKKIIYDVRDKVNSGSKLADSMGQHGKVFGQLYINMVGAGEASGALEQVLFRLADMQERQLRLTKKVQASLAYPILMAIFGFGVITALMTFVLPKILGVLERQNKELPAATQALKNTTDFITGYWYVILIVFAMLILAWRLWVSRPEGRRQWDLIKMRAPLFGKLYVLVISARFAHTLGTMLESGLTMMTSLDVVKTVIQNKVIEDAMDDIKAAVRRGIDLSVPMKQCGLFPPMLVQMTELGQRSGTMETMLLKVSETYEEDVEVTLEALVSLMEPMMILIMGLIVGFLVMAVLMPIMQMSQSVG